jgi:hypothetical protein
MSNARWCGVLLLAVLLATACGAVRPTATGGTTPSAPVTTSTATSPTAATVARLESPTTASAARTQDMCSLVQSAPKFAPSTPSARALASVGTKANQPDFVIRDITDIDHPFTVSSLGSQADYATRFVSAAEVSSAADGSLGLVRMPLSGSPKTVVAACGGKPFAWSPDGTAAAYMRGAANSKIQNLHLVSGGQDRVADSTPALDFGVGCESSSCANNWDIQMLYSPSGANISLVEQLPVSVFRIWTADGKVLKSLDSSSATMSVWSGDALYWRDDKGVEVWRNGSQSLLLPGVSWIRPHASPAGGQIVYETREPGYGTAHVFVLSTSSGKVREIAQSRSEAAFLTSRFVWYAGEHVCSDRLGYCALGPTGPTGVTYIYDLQTGAERESSIAYVWDVWPHPA